MQPTAAISDIRKRDTAQLMRVALGQEKADLVVTNARLLNVYTGELLENHAVGVKGKWIAYVGDDPGHTVGPATEVIDAGNKTLIPGLIEGHTHLTFPYTIDQFLQYAMTGGMTTVITESMEPFPVAGYDGVIDFLDSLRDQPIKFFATAPFMASISRRARGISIETLQNLLNRNDVLGIGESYWQSILQEPEQMIPALDETFRQGKSLEGHSAGAKGNKLMAYIATGISSCHEPIQADEVLERLRLGIYVMIREGSIRRDLEAIATIKDAGIDLRRLILVTDGVEPGDLLKKRCIEFVVQKAIDCGFDPVAAVQMATLNVAEHFSLDDLLGGIAPGRYADMLIVPDIHTIQAQTVISNGRIIAENGHLLVSPRKHTYQSRSFETIDLPKTFEAADFAIKAPATGDMATVRIMEMVTDLVTREHRQAVPVINAEIKMDAANDILKVAAIDRRHVPGKTYTGLIKGFGLQSGAFACSAGWDSSDIIVVGADETDMAATVNRIKELRGGVVVCENGNIQAEIPLPIFGIMSTEPVESIAQRIKAIKDAVSRLGVSFPDPILSLVTLTGAAIPYLRICEEGLVNLKDGKTVELVVE